MFDNMDVSEAAKAMPTDNAIDNPQEAPTSIPCGITISITLGC